MTALRPTSSRRTPYLAAGLAGAALVADVAFDPAHRHVPLCPFHAVTGWWCPLCGGLRAASALAHLDLRAALHDNVVFVLALPLIAWWWLAWLRTGRPRRFTRAGVVGLIVLGVAFTLVRNLPGGEALRPL
jgi:hypothetical protein